VLCVLPAGCAQVSGPDAAPFRPGPSSAPTGVEPVGDAVPCTGLAGYPLSSQSYVPGAPSIERDGDQFELMLTVLVPTGDGSCRALAGVLVEIWHTGDQPGYVPNRWRTALRSDETGSVRYRTTRPVQGEGPPHFHARVVATIEGVSYENDWTIAVQPETLSRLELNVLLSTDVSFSPPPSTTPASPGV
jgi:hypothetical protein